MVRVNPLEIVDDLDELYGALSSAYLNLSEALSAFTPALQSVFYEPEVFQDIRDTLQEICSQAQFTSGLIKVVRHHYVMYISNPVLHRNKLRHCLSVLELFSNKLHIHKFRLNSIIETHHLQPSETQMAQWFSLVSHLQIASREFRNSVKMYLSIRDMIERMV